MNPLSRARGRSGGKGGSAWDPALGDSALAAVRTALAQGRWTEARTLLADTGDDWDLRGHRMLVLAEGSTTAAWVREWQLAEPESADAAALLGCAMVFRSLRGQERPDAARESCRAAALLAPADPTPWLALLILARRSGADEERMKIFDQIRGRHRDHHHAHHLMTACLAESLCGSDNDPFHEVYEFAGWVAGQAPAGSPLCALPVIAHAERYRVLAAAGVEPGDPADSGHWKSRRARQVMKSAFDWWPENGSKRHPRRLVDLNFLAHAKFYAGSRIEATALFDRIGPHVTQAPWSYPDRDAGDAFRAARRASLASW